MADTPTYVDRCPELEKNDSLTSLHLVISNPLAATPTLQAIAGSSNLRGLWLESSGGDEGVGLLCEHTLLPNCYIETLRLDLKECSHLGIGKLAKVIRNRDNVRKLSLILNNAGPDAAKYLGEMLLASHLEEFSIYAAQLDLHDKCLGDEGVAVLSNALRVPNKLHSVRIAQSGLTDQGLRCITDALHANGTITHLDLSSNLIDSQGAELFAPLLGSHSCALKTLVLNSNHKLGDEGAKAIALALCKNTSLQVLSVQSCNIGGKGAEGFGTTLSQNKTLKEFSLRGNTEVGDSAVELISRGLRTNGGLLKLDLSSCGVGDEGCAHLAEALLDNQMLRELDLHKNNIGDGGIMALCQTLSKNL